MSVSESARWGLFRGLLVQTIACPMNAIATSQQATGLGVYTTFLEMQKGGRLFAGLRPELIKTSVKQGWTWPMMIHGPACFPGPPLVQQCCTGLAIACMDTAFLTPLAKWAVRVRLGEELGRGREMWSAAFPHLQKGSISWVTFMAAQHYFRGDRVLTLWESVVVGCQTTFVVASISAPFDQRHTAAQSKRSIRGVSPVAGLPMRLFALLINNIASIFVLNLLNRSSDDSLNP